MNMKSKTDVKKITLYCRSFWCDAWIRYNNGMVSSFPCKYVWSIKGQKRLTESELHICCPNCGAANYNIRRNRDWTEEFYNCPTLTLMGGTKHYAQGANLHHNYGNLWGISFTGGVYSSYLSTITARKIIEGEVTNFLHQNLTSSIRGLDK